jgi:uncharacterized glyoxalase superfamily protein PhnB
VSQSVALYLNYVTGVEAVWATMVDAGFTVTTPLEKQFWGQSRPSNLLFVA